MGYMKPRHVIKELARQSFAAQRGKCILSVFLVLLTSVPYQVVNRLPSYFIRIERITGWSLVQHELLYSIADIAPIFLLPFMILSIVLLVNLHGVMVKVFYGQPITSTEPYSALKINFGRKLGGSLWMALWTCLWMLLFIIPGIVKAFSYSMTQYILACHPNVTATDAIKLSKRMTKGYKVELFQLELSFIGWKLLNFLTLGILGIFFVNPYYYITQAGFFIELRNLAVANGVIHPAELDGISPQYPYEPQDAQQLQ